MNRQLRTGKLPMHNMLQYAKRWSMVREEDMVWMRWYTGIVMYEGERRR